MEKYKIKSCLNQLTYPEYLIAVKMLPAIIGKSHNTFWNYANMPLDSEKDVPHMVVVKLERFFKLHPGELLNQKIESPTIDQIMETYTSAGK